MENLKKPIIRYEENIFYLKLMLNNIKKSHNLNINTELFFLKIKKDMLFIDQTTGIIMDHLEKNDKLITKDELLHSILELKQLYVNECRRLIKENIILESDFIKIIDKNYKEIESIGDIIYKLERELNREDLTTNEELNILFTPDEEDDDEE